MLKPFLSSIMKSFVMAGFIFAVFLVPLFSSAQTLIPEQQNQIAIMSSQLSLLQRLLVALKASLATGIGGAAAIQPLLPSPLAFDFSLSSGGARTVRQGDSVSNTITAMLADGISQPVSFTISGIPTDVRYSYSPIECSPICSTVLTIGAGASTPIGSYTITVIGTSSSLSRSTLFTLTVNPALSTRFGFNDQVQTTATRLNVRATPSMSKIPLGIQPSGALGVMIGGPIYADGLYWWNINYKDGPDGWSAEDFLKKPSPSAFDFSLSNGGDPTVKRGASVSNSISATIISGTARSVSFSADGLPTGSSALFYPRSCFSTCTSTLTISTTDSTDARSYQILVRATTDGDVSRITRFILNVTLVPPPPPLPTPTPPPPPPGGACSVTSVGYTPLNDLGTGTYKGYQGGLYPGGINTRPNGHESTGLSLAKLIQPLDASGNADNINGKYVFLSIGMSNAKAEFGQFKTLADVDVGKDSKLVIVNGATGGCAAISMSTPGLSAYDSCWKAHVDALGAAGVTANQVAALWVKQAIAGPTGTFPAEETRLQDALDKIIFIEAKKRFPNLKVVYVSGRIYAGYATTTQNPEPYAYQSAFSVKWLAEKHINDTTAPWVAWGPYLWADGLKPRSDGLIWECADFQSDGTHPSTLGQIKVADILMDFVKTDSTAREWFLATPTTTPTPTPPPPPPPPPTPTPTPPPSTKFIIGDRVQTTDNLNVRSCADLSCTILGTQLIGTLGTVSGGPTTANGYNWWSINYDTGPDGWSVEDWLAPISSVPMSYNVPTDLAVRPEPALPTVGAAGSIITDATFGSRILRVTDENTGAQLGSSFANRSFNTTASAETAVFNKTSTRFFLNDGTGNRIVLFNFNPATLSFSINKSVSPNFNGISDLAATPAFSLSEPDILYGFRPSAMHSMAQYDFATDTYSTVINMDTGCSGLALTSSDSTSSIDNGGDTDSDGKDDRLIVATGGASQDNWKVLVVWDRKGGCRWYNISTGQVGGSWGTIGTAAVLATANPFIHNVRISRDGKYAAIASGSGLTIWEIDTLVTRACTVTCAGHRSWGYGKLFSGGSAGWFLRDGISPNMPTTLASRLDRNDQHNSWNNARIAMSSPVVATTFLNTSDQTIKNSHENEIIAIATDGSGTVWRLAHHRSNCWDGSTCQFWETPRGSISQDGRFVVFTSNWERTLPTDNRGVPRHDAFIVELPE